MGKTCYSHECATVTSEGTHPVGEGACRNYTKYLFTKKSAKKTLFSLAAYDR